MTSLVTRGNFYCEKTTHFLWGIFLFSESEVFFVNLIDGSNWCGRFLEKKLTLGTNRAQKQRHHAT